MPFRLVGNQWIDSREPTLMLFGGAAGPGKTEHWRRLYWNLPFSTKIGFDCKCSLPPYSTNCRCGRKIYNCTFCKEMDEKEMTKKMDLQDAVKLNTVWTPKVVERKAIAHGRDRAKNYSFCNPIDPIKVTAREIGVPEWGVTLYAETYTKAYQATKAGGFFEIISDGVISDASSRMKAKPFTFGFKTVFNVPRDAEIKGRLTAIEMELEKLEEQEDEEDSRHNKATDAIAEAEDKLYAERKELEAELKALTARKRYYLVKLPERPKMVSETLWFNLCARHFATITKPQLSGRDNLHEGLNHIRWVLLCGRIELSSKAQADQLIALGFTILEENA